MPRSSNGLLSPFVFFLLFSPKFAFSDSDSTRVQSRRFDRPDPFNHFKYYKGGFDVRNKHYWTSAAFTGVHGYAIGAAWLVCGLTFAVLVAVKYSTNSLPSGTYRRHGRRYRLMVLLAIFFAFIAIVATGIVLASNQKSLHATKKLKTSIINTGDDAGRTIRSLIKSMTNIQDLLLPYDPKTTTQLNITSHRLGNESLIIQRFLQNDGHAIDLAIEFSYILHIVIVSVNLVLLIASLVLLFLHWSPGFVIIIIFCWILTTLCWVLTGYDFFLHTFAEDACSALKGFVQNPNNNTLSSILPCMDLSHSDKILADIGSNIHSVIAELNSKIAAAGQFSTLTGDVSDLAVNGVICDPFSGSPNYTYTPELCSKDAISISEFADIIGRFTCYTKDSPENCKNNGKFISEQSYNKARAYSDSVQEMLNVFPDLRSLIECTVIKGTFSDIVMHQCKPFKVSTRCLWSAMLVLSISLVVLVSTWVGKAFRDRRSNFSLFSTNSGI